MQPTLVDTPPAGSDWLHEIKYDGYRTQLAIWSGHALAYSRNGNNWTAKFGAIVEDAKAIPALSALIDGEVCVQDENGVTDFTALPTAITWHPERLVFFAFDLLHLDGDDLTGKSLEERRAKLRWLVDQVPGSRIVMSDEFAGDGKAFFDLADKHGLEGIVSKRKGSRYLSGSSRDWLKIKCWKTSTMDVIGVDRDKDGVPYALLADADGNRGAAYIGLPGDLRGAFWRYVEGRAADASPIAGIKRKASWLRPGMTAQVRYLKGSDKLRHAVVQAIEVEK
ncbi:MAG: ATP-dependent DNA ligase [Alphaproteobacteria bacterium]|nr:ATP-dependent DNA ligase [Alphaproteobacteria bacterium]MBU1561515.1 ATP-dependent DNA ligase [Alphaproteobacteria bacterium]MBU2300962.1 ATP-dependent DNA ligase [Alphaproteobacteria bacterium]MBU2368413.1 ATP-dependent DNA ligase [Alphaproteobacteria bacterium]